MEFQNEPPSYTDFWLAAPGILVQGSTKHLISFPVEYQILIICKAANIKSRHLCSLNTVRNQYAISTAFPVSSIYTGELYVVQVQ